MSAVKEAIKNAISEAIPTDPLRAPTTKAAPYPVEALGGCPRIPTKI